jgi:acylphosphatase
MTDGEVRLTARVRGRVQGVGFRYWVCDRGAELGLRGVATNCADGSVEVIAEGPRAAAQQLLGALTEARSNGGRPGRVSGVSERWGPASGLSPGFRAH